MEGLVIYIYIPMQLGLSNVLFKTLAESHINAKSLAHENDCVYIKHSLNTVMGSTSRDLTDQRSKIFGKRNYASNEHAQFYFYLFCLFEWQRDSEKNKDLLSTGSLLKCLQQPGMGKVKAGSWKTNPGLLNGQ